MKNFILFVIIAGTVMVVAQSWNYNDPDTKTSIEFYNSGWNDILEKARAQNKPIFLDIYATWCGPCKQLKKNTFSDEEVGKYFNTHFINAAFDAEKGEGLILAERYGIHSYPTMLFINPDGTVKETVIGYRNAKQLLKEATQQASN